jgi:spore maturation protein CgeB
MILTMNNGWPFEPWLWEWLILDLRGQWINTWHRLFFMSVIGCCHNNGVGAMNDVRRILVVLPMYGGSLPIGRYCTNALRELGHVVEVFEAPAFYGSFAALKELRVGTDRLDYLENSFLQVVSQAILAKVEFFAPDLVLALAQAPLSLQALKRLRRDQVATAMWFVEDYEVFTYWQTFAPYYDLFAIIQKGAFPEQLGQIGQQNSLY